MNFSSIKLVIQIRSFVLFLMVLGSFSCTSINKKDTIAIGAYFDNFTYSGEDDFYKKHPLPNEHSFYNPILPGWYSDPSVCKKGDDYFLVTSTFSYYPGVPIFHSKDLMNWKQIGHVLDRPSQLKLLGQRISQGIFAPDISYNPHNETFYMITTNIGGGNFFVKTKDPFGAWSEPVFLPEVEGIDPSFFFDDDGKAYVINNDAPVGGSTYDGHRSIRIQAFDVDKEVTFGPRKMIVNGGAIPTDKPIWIEGPHIYKIHGKYFLMCAEGGTSVNHTEVIFKSDDVLGDYIPWDRNPILTQKGLDANRESPITCAGHADIIQKNNGKWWGVFLACRPIENQFENLGRETFLLPVRWSEDGYPVLTDTDEVIPRIVQMENVKRKHPTTFGNFSFSETFDHDTLPIEWMTVRGDASHLYSLTERSGYLKLTFEEATASELDKIPALVTRRVQHHKFSSKVMVQLATENPKEQAGITLLKDEKHQYAFLMSKPSEDMVKFSLQKISDGVIEELTFKEIKTNETYPEAELKVVSTGKYFSFYFQLKDSNSYMKLADKISTEHLSTAKAGGFTGTTIGVYATASSKPTK